jgi:hypothetical protein
MQFSDDDEELELSCQLTEKQIDHSFLADIGY